jgi:hypothetical protein
LKKLRQTWIWRGNSSLLSKLDNGSVIPAQAGIQNAFKLSWIPAFAGMTALGNGQLKPGPGKKDLDLKKSRKTVPDNLIFSYFGQYAYSADSGHSIRSKADTYSGAFRTPIPGDPGHPIRVERRWRC